MTENQPAYLYVASEYHAVTSDRLNAVDLIWRGQDAATVLRFVRGFFDGNWPPRTCELDGLRRIDYPRTELMPDCSWPSRLHVAIKFGLGHPGGANMSRYDGVTGAAVVLAAWWGKPATAATMWSDLDRVPLPYLLWDPPALVTYLQASALAAL